MSWQGEEVEGLVRQLKGKILKYFLEDNPNEYLYSRKLYDMLDATPRATNWEPWKPRTIEERVTALENKAK